MNTSNMTINERVEWLHRDCVSLASTDLVELKYSLDQLIDDATQIREDVSTELKRQRSIDKRPALTTTFQSIGVSYIKSF